MEEYQRLKINNKILSEYNDIIKLNEKKEQLEKYKNNPIVKEYLKLFESIKKLTYIQSIYSDECGNIDLNSYYLKRINNMIPKNNCNHDIYVYTSSYSMIRDPYYCDEKPYSLESENSEGFAYNEYMCLECGKEENVEDWKEFEKNHIVLKNYDMRFKLWILCHKAYCEKLFSMSSEEAKEEIINMYNNDLVEKNKIKKCDYKK